MKFELTVSINSYLVSDYSFCRAQKPLKQSTSMLLKMVIGTAIILLGMYLKRIWKSWRYTMAPAWDDLSRVLSSLPPGPFARKLYQARQELFVTGPGVRKEAAIWLSRNQAIVDIVINKPSILSRLINVQLKERAHIHLKSALDYTVKSLLSNCDTPKFALNLEKHRKRT